MSTSILNVLVSTLLLSTSFVAPVYADNSSAGGTAKTVGQKAGEAVHEVGDAGKQVGHKVAEAARETGHAFRDGAKEFHKSVKGNGKKKTHAPSSASSK